MKRGVRWARPEAPARLLPWLLGLQACKPAHLHTCTTHTFTKTGRMEGQERVAVRAPVNLLASLPFQSSRVPLMTVATCACLACLACLAASSNPQPLRAAGQMGLDCTTAIAHPVSA